MAGLTPVYRCDASHDLTGQTARYTRTQALFDAIKAEGDVEVRDFLQDAEDIPFLYRDMMHYLRIDSSQQACKSMSELIEQVFQLGYSINEPLSAKLSLCQIACLYVCGESVEPLPLEQGEAAGYLEILNLVLSEVRNHPLEPQYLKIHAELLKIRQ